jgi:hypothetical protein
VCPCIEGELEVEGALEVVGELEIVGEIEGELEIEGMGDGMREGISEGIADFDGGGDGIADGSAEGIVDVVGGGDGVVEGSAEGATSSAFRGWGKNQYWSGSASFPLDPTNRKVDWGLVSRIRSLKLTVEGELETDGKEEGISEGIVEGGAEGIVGTSSCVIRGRGKNQYRSVSSDASFTFDIAILLTVGLDFVSRRRSLTLTLWFLRASNDREVVNGKAKSLSEGSRASILARTSSGIRDCTGWRAEWPAERRSPIKS